MGVPHVIQHKGHRYYRYVSDPSYRKIQKIIAWAKKRYNSKYYILKTDSVIGSYTIYNLYLTKVQHIG